MRCDGPEAPMLTIVDLKSEEATVEVYFLYPSYLDKYRRFGKRALAFTRIVGLLSSMVRRKGDLARDRCCWTPECGLGEGEEQISRWNDTSVCGVCVTEIDTCGRAKDRILGKEDFGNSWKQDIERITHKYIKIRSNDQQNMETVDKE
ncbi:hypothetical protein H920_04667 [Fukomys damarensis]|uniref:Uncharacterized protein n=1 Tax=Fukomys damarensis TaxID=885580 RepID=A0A091DS31_FUKDA|nr:hypothetical protein H920_04667 [Fukomys damarensis]